MQRFLTSLLLALILLWPAMPAQAYTFQYPDANNLTPIKWPTNTINVALSTSLQSPPSNIKAGSDAVGAAQRALAHWASVANIQFNISTSSQQTINPSGSNSTGGFILITVAASNAGEFNGTQLPGEAGKARVFRQGSTIVEADIAVNPNVQFSTDGTDNTFDLEATLAHEIGHALGLEHSGIVGATMQPIEGQNGQQSYFINDAPPNGFDFFPLRALSDDDRAAIRTLYNPQAADGAISGTVTFSGSSTPAFGAHVWAEDVATGRVRAGNITLPNGAYRIDNLPPGRYNVKVQFLQGPILAARIASLNGAYAGLQNAQPPFQTVEVAPPLTVTAGAVTPLNIPVGGTPTINPNMLGLTGPGGLAYLSASVASLTPGQTTTVFIAGPGLDSAHVPSSGISITSPSITVNQTSVKYLTAQDSQGNPLPVISFSVTVDPSAPAGLYSIRLQSNSGEVAYLTGGLTITLPAGVTSGNRIDDPTFYVTQHYLDFLNRQPDQAGLNFWVNQITSCNGDPTCIDIKRQNVSAAYFLSREFQETGFFVIKVQRAAFGHVSQDPTKRISYLQFVTDSAQVGKNFIDGQPNADTILDQNKTAYVQAVVASVNFVAQYPNTMSASAFVDALFMTAGVTPSSAEREAAISAFGSGDVAGRAAALRSVAETDSVKAAEFNPAFVLLQYFGYLRRNPTDPPDNNDAGYQFWLGKLNSFNGDYIGSQMVRSFIVSTEYRQRFGPS